jgi:PAS domain S-box-containing protein
MAGSNSQIGGGESSNKAEVLSSHSESESLKLLVESLNDYALYMLGPDGAIASWNPGAEKITGYRTAEAVGHNFSLLFTDEDRGAATPAQLLQEASLDGRSESECWLLRRDGSRFLASVLIQPVPSAEGHPAGFAMVLRDVTDQVAEREAQLENERQYRLLVDGVVDYAIYLLDPAGLIVNWNTGAQRIVGYEPHEIVGQHFSRFYTKEDRTAGLPWRVLEIAAHEGRYESEGWRVRKDGTRFWASVVVDAIRDAAGAVTGFAEVTRDVSKRRATQEALRESERQFRLLVGSVTDYALFMLDPNGVVASWNAGAGRIKGYTAGEIVGQHFSRFYNPHDRAAGVPARALQIAASEGRYEAEGWRVRKNGERFWANVVIHPVRDEDGSLIGFAKITQDNTKKRDAEIALQKAQEHRGRAQRMEALGHLTGGVAHDFNNLLMIVGGFSQTLKKLAGQDPKGLRALEAIEGAVEKGQSLTRQLLTFSRRQTLNPVVTGIAERIEAFRRMLGSSNTEKARLVADIPPNIWTVKADISEFELALLNITLNAREAMPEGGVITITAENVELKREDSPGQLEGDFAAITIADTGTGIPEEILPKVFDPFFTTKGGTKEPGLGLSQVHGFAHQSGGTVAIESKLGRGTRVTLYLPRAKSLPERVAGEAVRQATGGGRALLVDDNRDVLEVSALYLRELGYEVDTLDSAAPALKAVEREHYSLVVSDVVMAGMDGIDLAQAIRKKLPGMPIVLVTGYSKVPPSVGEEFVLVRKPYQLEDLSRAVSAAIAAVTKPGNLVHLGPRRAGRRQDPS